MVQETDLEDIVMVAGETLGRFGVMATRAQFVVQSHLNVLIERKTGCTSNEL